MSRIPRAAVAALASAAALLSVGCGSTFGARRRRRAMSRYRVALGAGAAALLASVLLPAPALAHGLVGKQDLPIPRWLFAWAAAVVLVVSFVALGSMWKRARWEQGVPAREVLRVPRLLEPVCGAIGIAIFVLGVYTGLAGSKVATDNLLPTLVYVLFWVGVPCASALFGDVFRAFNPWLAIARASGWLVARVAGDAVPEPLAYPERLGRWPAVVGIFCFAWLELVYTNKADPPTLAFLAIAYCIVQLVAMSALRHPGLVTPRRRVRRLLQPLLAPGAAALARRRARGAPAARRRHQDHARRRHRRAAVRDDRLDELRRVLVRVAVERHQRQRDRRTSAGLLP